MSRSMRGTVSVLFRLPVIVVLSVIIASCASVGEKAYLREARNDIAGEQASSDSATDGLMGSVGGASSADNIGDPISWTFFKHWRMDSQDRELLLSLVPLEDMTLSGQCDFSPKLWRLYNGESKGMILPIFSPKRDQEFVPDRALTIELREQFAELIPLVGVSDSEHFLDQLMLVAELLNQQVYNKGAEATPPATLDRKSADLLVQAAPSVDYFISNTLGLFDVETLASYQDELSIRGIKFVQRELLQRQAGRVRLDWLALTPNEEKLFESMGNCTLTWIELDQLRKEGGVEVIEHKSLATVYQVMMSHYLAFSQEMLRSINNDYRFLIESDG